MANVRIGEIVVSSDPSEELVAIGLGSCIGLVMVDRQAGVAGVAHVMLPRSGSATDADGKFADTAVPELLSQLTARGALRPRLRVAIAGGAAMFGAGGALDIGQRNADAVRDALTSAGVRCHADDTGGAQGRTLRVSVATGTATVRIAGGTTTELLPSPPAQRKVA